MNRCFSRPTGRHPLFSHWFAGWLLACFALCVSAQTAAPRIPPIAAKALVGEFAVTMPPEVLLNQKPARLSPGARIHGFNNLTVLSGTLIGKTYTVRYVLDPLGLVHEVWLLTPAEMAALPKS